MKFYQTQSHAIVLHNTLPAVCIEKAVCMKTKAELYHKICLTPRLPRVVLKANSHSGQQNQREHGARTFLACLLSTVEQQDTNRKGKVKKLIEQFESHPNKEPFLQDLSQTQRIAGFDRRPEQHGDFRTLRNLFQKAMPRLPLILERSVKMFKIATKNKRVRQEQLRRLINSSLWC